MMSNSGRRLTQGQFSFLPDLSDQQIAAQIDYALGNNWAVGIEYTDDPHPRNTYWEMYGNPMFDVRDANEILRHIAACRASFPTYYIRVTAFDSTRGWETLRMSYLVNRPSVEPGFALERQERGGRSISYTTRSYAADRPESERYS